MRNEALVYIPDDVMEQFEQFEDDYVADVLRVWDCYAQDWLDGVITVFRFESDDLLVWNEGDCLKCKRGPVDTQVADLSFMKDAATVEQADTCLCWRPDKGYAHLIGNCNVGTDLLQCLGWVKS